MIYRKGEILLASSGEDAEIYQSSFEKAYVDLARTTQETLEMLGKKRYDVVLIDESIEDPPYNALEKIVPAVHGAMTFYVEEHKQLAIDEIRKLRELIIHGFGSISKQSVKPEKLESLIIMNFDAQSLIIMHNSGFSGDEMRAMGIPILKPGSY